MVEVGFCLMRGTSSVRLTSILLLMSKRMTRY